MQLQIDDQKKEIKEHGSYHFPLLISHESLSDFDTKSFLCHWHPEIELTLVQEGMRMYFMQVRGIPLRTADTFL